MLSRNDGALVTLLIVATAAGVVACRKKNVALGDASVDASADASPGEGGASTSSDELSADGGAPAIDAGVMTAALAAANAAAAAANTPDLPRPTPFSGSYGCFKGMQLVQVGTIVTATIHKDGTTDTVIACTAGADTCVGTVREIQTARGKPPKVLHVKPVLLTRTTNGDILFKVTGGERTASGSTSSKPSSSAGEPTFCPRTSAR